MDWMDRLLPISEDIAKKRREAEAQAIRNIYCGLPGIIRVMPDGSADCIDPCDFYVSLPEPSPDAAPNQSAHPTE